jgi:hypothetical protein
MGIEPDHSLVGYSFCAPVCPRRITLGFGSNSRVIHLKTPGDYVVRIFFAKRIARDCLHGQSESRFWDSSGRCCAECLHNWTSKRKKAAIIFVVWDRFKFNHLNCFTSPMLRWRTSLLLWTEATAWPSLLPYLLQELPQLP